MCLRGESRTGMVYWSDLNGGGQQIMFGGGRGGSVCVNKHT